ncbi:zinc metalloproteinase nas-4 [Exaiptasia diaphana]|uniref:Metalloendopeptidase n=1 Tax=Exaiptasia diaphana TaxID=2652724 RepID=A0A913Y1B8_EXADI|nr:zinc metalloproteinase nas-4 [Exaiptasia diaphana]
MADVETVQDVFNEEFEDNAEQQGLLKDQELMDIANREYETIHGRILAINMATLGKRRLQSSPRTGNAFENIENVNDGKHLNLYEGDIQMDEDLERYLHMPVRSMTKRNAIREKKRIWSTKIIPYKIPGFMSHIRQNLMKAIAGFQKHTCLRFVPYRPGVHRNYITFNKAHGCSSKVGTRYYSPGPQAISLGDGCNNPSTITHELMHAIGFFHEQSRSDRDRYVRINWENIFKGTELRRFY